MSWYRTFFTEQYLRGREHLLMPERTAQEADFIVETLALTEGATVLDLCCGQGRHAIELARRGFRVTGLDLSEYLLGVARERAAQGGVNVRFVHSDARDNPFADEFDAVVNMFTAFAYLETEEEDQKVLNGVARSLKRGGRFLIQFVNRERVLRQFQPKGWERLEDGTLFLAERRFDVNTGRIHATETLLLPDGRREESWHEIRFYTCPELRRMLKEAGLNVTATFGEIDGSELGLDTRWLILVAEKE